MTFSARAVLTDASTTLIDPDFVRWPLPEMLGYLNDGIAETVAIRPTVATQTVTIALAQGALQALPAQFHSLTRVIRNLTTGHDEPGGPVGGPVITPIASRDIVDAMIPEWHYRPDLFHGTVQHVIYDPVNPRQFYVVPANTGAGKIEAVVAAPITPLAQPVTNPDQIGSYNLTIPLEDAYKPVLTHYVLHRAFTKDSAIAASAARAVAHRQAFDAALAGFGQTAAALAAGVMAQVTA